MSPVIFLFMFTEYMTSGDCRCRQKEVNYYGPFQSYAQPVHLPFLPQYEIDIPEQEGKLFGGVAATRYETIIVRETIRPVCLFVDGNMPSCDHIHNYNNNHPKDGMALNARRPTLVDNESYFIEPSKPDIKIEITEIPFKGAYMLTGTSVEPEEDHAMAATGGHATPSLSSELQRVAESVNARTMAASTTGRDGRQFLQNALGAAGTAIAAGLGANAAGLVGNAGGLLQPQGGVAGLAAVGAAAVGHGGNRNQVTLYVTRVDKVLDDHVTVTLVPRNCVPAAGQVQALRPCSAVGYHPYAAASAEHAYRAQQTYDDQLQDPEETQWPHPQDVVSRVDGLVRELVASRTAAAARGHPVQVPF